MEKSAKAGVFIPSRLCYRSIVGDVPVKHRLHLRSCEIQRVKLSEDVSLKLLTYLTVSKSRDRYLGYLKRLTELGKYIKSAYDHLGIIMLNTAHKILLNGFGTLKTAKNVALHSDLINRRAVGDIILYLKIILITVSSDAYVLGISVIYHQFFVGEIFTSHLPYSRADIALVCKYRTGGSIMSDRHLVGHLDLVHFPRITFRDLRKAFFIQPPHSIVVILRQPRGDYLIIKQAMDLRKYSLLLTVLHTKICGGTAVFGLRTVRIISKLALLGLCSRPKKRNGSKIKISCKGIPITGIYLSILVFVKHKEICTVLKIVILLIYVYLGANYRISVLIKNAKCVVDLAVFVYIYSRALV